MQVFGKDTDLGEILFGEIFKKSRDLKFNGGEGKNTMNGLEMTMPFIFANERHLLDFTP